MVPVFTVLLVLALSLLIVRFATVGLTMTGVSKDLAQFQALSAFTGSGFTTKESEEIVSHPVRRRIVMHLMLLGHGGIVIGITSVMLSFLNTTAASSSPTSSGGQSSLIGGRVLVLALGILGLWLAANSQVLERLIWEMNTWAFKRWGRLELHDYTKLLRFAQSYVVWELRVQPDSWLVGRTLVQLQLNREGILVLGVERADGKYLGAPRGSTCIHPHDCLILYGRQESLADLETRRADLQGNMHHVMAVTTHLDVLETEDKMVQSRHTGG